MRRRRFPGVPARPTPSKWYHAPAPSAVAVPTSMTSRNAGGYEHRDDDATRIAFDDLLSFSMPGGAGNGLRHSRTTGDLPPVVRGELIARGGEESRERDARAACRAARATRLV